MLKVLLNDLGFNRSAIDHSIFYRQNIDEHVVVAVATDDMAVPVTSKQAKDATKFKSEISKHWEITDHGPISWFFGFQIERDRESRTISINQCVYIESMAEIF
jgi:hypothetical protein